MWRCAAIAALVLFSGHPLWAEVKEAPAARLQQQFHEAGRAYDEGRMPDAVRLYEGLISAGYPSMEVFFNLGNAYFKGGRLGPAVLNYRKAWRLAPRDPDIAANVRFALQAAGVPEPELSVPEAVFARLTEREWAIAGMAAWWTTILLLGLGILVRNWRGLMLRVAAVLGAVTVTAVLGLWTWRGFDRNPELVVLDSARQALFAPLAASTPHYPLPEGSVVRAREYQDDWVKVTLGKRAGWIRRADCAPVLLRPSPDWPP